MEMIDFETRTTTNMETTGMPENESDDEWQDHSSAMSCFHQSDHGSEEIYKNYEYPTSEVAREPHFLNEREVSRGRFEFEIVRILFANAMQQVVQNRIYQEILVADEGVIPPVEVGSNTTVQLPLEVLVSLDAIVPEEEPDDVTSLSHKTT